MVYPSFSKTLRSQLSHQWILSPLSEQYHVNSEHIKQISFDKHVKTSVRILLSCIFKAGNRTSRKETYSQSAEPHLWQFSKLDYFTTFIKLQRHYSIERQAIYLNKRILWLVDSIRLGIQNETHSSKIFTKLIGDRLFLKQLPLEIRKNFI